MDMTNIKLSEQERDNLIKELSIKPKTPTILILNCIQSMR